MLSPKSYFVLIIVGLLLLVGYFEWEVLPPFILGGVFAYVLYPLASFIHIKSRISWKLSASLTYLLIVGICLWITSIVGAKLADELSDLAKGTPMFIRDLSNQAIFLPASLQSQFKELLETVRFSLQTMPIKALPYFPGALSKLVSIFIFLVAGFYMLVDGKESIEKFLSLLSSSQRSEVNTILSKINKVINSYLRGQLLLVAIMMVLSFVLLTIFGVKYALVLSVIIGLAELVPYAGPIIAGIVTAIVVFFDPGDSFKLFPIYKGAIAGLGYVLLNQLENLIIVPQIVKATTNIHPMIAMFAVLAGGHTFGVLGVVLAIPVVSIVKILLEYWLEKITRKS